MQTSNPLAALADHHESLKAQFGKLSEARSMLDQARSQLANLTKLGDMVQPEDVIKAAGRLVAAGLSPMAMAKLLSDMPEKGDQLQAWVGQHVQALGQREAQLEPVLASARHELGVAAMRSIIGHTLAGPTASLAPPASASAPGNALSPAPATEPAAVPIGAPDAS